MDYRYVGRFLLKPGSHCRGCPLRHPPLTLPLHTGQLLMWLEVLGNIWLPTIR